MKWWCLLYLHFSKCCSIGLLKIHSDYTQHPRVIDFTWISCYRNECGRSFLHFSFILSYSKLFVANQLTVSLPIFKSLIFAFQFHSSTRPCFFRCSMWSLQISERLYLYLWFSDWEVSSLLTFRASFFY